MINAVFSNKLKWVVCIICLEHSDSSFRKGNTKLILLTVPNLNIIASFNIIFRVSSSTNRNRVIFPNSNVVYFRDELNLLFGIIIQSYLLAEGVHVIVWKWFLREGRSRRSIPYHRHHRNSIFCVHGSRRWNNVDISSDQFEFCILIFLSTPVVDSDPTSKICIIFIRTQSDWVVWFPWKSRSSICDLTVSGNSIEAVDLPAQSGKSKESIRQWGERNSFNIIENLNSIWSLHDISAVIAQQGTVDSFTGLS